VNRWALRGGAVFGACFLMLFAGAGAASVALSGESVGRLLADDRSAHIEDLEGGGVRVTAPAGVPLLALASGRAHRMAGGALQLDGEKDAAGFVVTYANAAAPAADNEVAAGAAVGVVPPSGTVDVSATLEGSELDLGALIEDNVAVGGVPAAPPGAMVRPLPGATVSQEFGCTAFTAEPVEPACPGGHFHSGIDLAAPLGTPVHAALGGRAHLVRTQGGYGLRVELTHSGGQLTLYGHLSGVDVGDGDEVAPGDVVGRVGSSGNSTGPHLHFEVRRAGVAEDPRIDVALP
jgi:murein DD-endopeptidase MepM/ murein hydrolase activator NlpD